MQSFRIRYSPKYPIIWEKNLFTRSFQASLSSATLPQCLPHSTILLWIPILYTILFTPAFLHQAKRARRRFEPLPFGLLLLWKLVSPFTDDQLSNSSFFQASSIILTGANLFVLFIKYPGPAGEYVIPLLMTIAWVRRGLFRKQSAKWRKMTSNIKRMTPFLIKVMWPVHHPL